MSPSPFNDLFVLELANNHWGSIDRGLKIIDDFARIARSNSVRSAIKLQFRDVESFVHKDHRGRDDHRYIKKIQATRLTWRDLALLVEAVRDVGLETMVTPFDEVSVGRCVDFGVDFLKVASSDIRDRSLLPRMAATRKPVIASSGGSSLRDVDQLVEFFGARDIPFALNHCVSIYPSEDGELELNQIDFLRDRYPGVTIGFSTHEYRDWQASVMMAYAKGARTFERHVDIDLDGIPVSPYCSLPEQVDEWFKAFLKAKEMCGGEATAKRVPPTKETLYLDELVRGVYASGPLPRGRVLTADDVYFAVPLSPGQLSVREFTGGEVLRHAIAPDAPLLLRDVDTDYAMDLALRRMVEHRGTPAPPGRMVG
ncbi:MAG: N-acetylneuraminate synthase family protein [Caulobacteraceae bacterium]